LTRANLTLFRKIETVFSLLDPQTGPRLDGCSGVKTNLLSVNFFIRSDFIFFIRAASQEPACNRAVPDMDKTNYFNGQ